MNEVTDDAKRIAVAELDGYRWCRVGSEEKPFRMLCIWNPVYTAADGSEPICNPAYMWEHGQIPDYLNDRDAICAVVEKLPNEKFAEFGAKLALEVFDYPPDRWSGCSLGLLANATAEQHVDALLRVMGKMESWRNGPRKGLRLIIAGGRNFIPSDEHYAWLDEIAASNGPLVEVVSGGAHGGDSVGEEWFERCKVRNLGLKRFLPDWQKFGKAAGPIRNEEMAKYANAVALFPGGSGTADMKRRAEAHGLKIFEWKS